MSDQQTGREEFYNCPESRLATIEQNMVREPETKSRRRSSPRTPTAPLKTIKVIPRDEDIPF